MDIKKKLSARLARLQAAKTNGQKGLGIGAIILVVILLGAVAYAASKFGGDTPSGDKQKIRLDAGALASQTVQLRNGLVLTASETDVTWTGVANKSGRLSLANATTDYTSAATVPVGPVGTDGNAITWAFGSGVGMSNTPNVYAWTGNTVSQAVCTAFNVGVNGGTGTPATHALTGIGTAVAQTLVTGNADAYTVVPSLAIDLDAALGGKSAACVDAGGSYRIVAKLNN